MELHKLVNQTECNCFDMELEKLKNEVKQIVEKYSGVKGIQDEVATLSEIQNKLEMEL